MAGRQRNTYSVIVAWAKILLPVVALGLLSTVFLLSRRIDPEGAIPFAEVDIAEMVREQRLSKPNYSGVTSDGSTVTVVADSARPEIGGTDGGTAQKIVAQMKQPDGTIINLSSDAGAMDGHQKLTLNGNVEIDTSNGFHLRSQKIVSLLQETDITSPGPVSANGPFGTLTAGSMYLTIPKGQEGILAVFDEGVHLIYEVNQERPED